MREGCKCVCVYCVYKCKAVVFLVPAAVVPFCWKTVDIHSISHENHRPCSVRVVLQADRWTDAV